MPTVSLGGWEHGTGVARETFFYVAAGYYAAKWVCWFIAPITMVYGTYNYS